MVSVVERYSARGGVVVVVVQMVRMRMRMKLRKEESLKVISSALS